MAQGPNGRSVFSRGHRERTGLGKSSGYLISALAPHLGESSYLVIMPVGLRVETLDVHATGPDGGVGNTEVDWVPLVPTRWLIRRGIVIP